jgi:hypothetical protein
MSKQVNREGYDWRSTKIMLDTPITELSRYIARKWFGTVERLSERSGVVPRTISQALSGKKIMPCYEKRLRAFLDKL